MQQSYGVRRVIGPDGSMIERAELEAHYDEGHFSGLRRAADPRVTCHIARSPARRGIVTESPPAAVLASPSRPLHPPSSAPPSGCDPAETRPADRPASGQPSKQHQNRARGVCAGRGLTGCDPVSAAGRMPLRPGGLGYTDGDAPTQPESPPLAASVTMTLRHTKPLR